MADASAEPSAAQGIPWAEVFRRAPGSALLATGLGTGLLPKAPGTWGSLLALVLSEGLFAASGTAGVAALSAASILVGVPVSSRVAALLGRKDPPEIVVDEVAGMSLALAVLHGVLPGTAPGPVRWGLVALAFGLFRVLDIAKPGWIDRAQSLPGGWGVMADDVLAGAVAGILAAAAAYLLS